jgi:tetratricopeptide (TPR) repeat protein
MTISRAALAATLVAGAATLLVPAAPAAAQSALDSLRGRQSTRNQQQQQQQQQQQEGQPAAQPRPAGQIANLTREESAAIMPLYTAVQAQDWPTATAALAAAQAGAQSPAARYLVGQLQFQIGRNTQSVPVQSQALDAMVASGGAPAEALPTILGLQANLALDANNFAAAEAALTRLVQLAPDDVAHLTQLAQVKVRLNKRPEAFPLFQRAIQLSEAGGQHAPEPLYRQTLGVAYEARMVPQAIALSRTLVTLYPNADNWRAVLGVYRDIGGVTGSELDVRRLMRATGSLASERDYFEYAQAANRGGLPGEVKAVLDEAMARNVFRGAAADARAMLTQASARITEDRASLPRLRTAALAAGTGQQARITGDAYYGYAQYADAAAMYRAALQKGGEDAGLINLRLGAALAMAGQRAEAEAALHAVTGARADLAQYWLLWLAQAH